MYILLKVAYEVATHGLFHINVILSGDLIFMQWWFATDWFSFITCSLFYYGRLTDVGISRTELLMY